MDRIYITGFMGSGKSTYGKELATELGYDFLDLDEAITKKSGLSITQIFEKQGEENFRKLESEALKETEKLKNFVIATGGGTPCFNNQMQWMNEHGKTIYLKMFDGDLYARLLEEQEERPLIKGKSEEELQNFVYKTLRERAVFYHQAEILIDPLRFAAKDLAAILQGKEIIPEEKPVKKEKDKKEKKTKKDKE